MTSRSARVKVPEHQWVKWPNHHPAYMSQAQQEGQSALFRRAYPGHGAWITFAVPDVDGDRRVPPTPPCLVIHD